MSQMEITPEVFTADYAGEPGQRTFFMQSRGEWGTLTYLVEKQQVVALGERLRDVLILVDETDPVNSAMPARDPALALSTPIEPEWRVGTLGLSYEEDEDRVVVLMEPVEEPETQVTDEDPPPPSESSVRFLLRRDQVRSFILHALAVVGEGRATCPLCGLAMNPAGHECPASNGHHLTV